MLSFTLNFSSIKIIDLLVSSIIGAIYCATTVEPTPAVALDVVDIIASAVAAVYTICHHLMDLFSSSYNF